MMGLGYFDTESESSTTFGALICMSGMIATPLGGVILDRVLATATQRHIMRTQPLLLFDAGWWGLCPFFS